MGKLLETYLWENVLWIDVSKLERVTFALCLPLQKWSIPKTNNNKKDVISVKHGAGLVISWSCFASWCLEFVQSMTFQNFQGIPERDMLPESSCRSTVQQIANPQEWQITKHDVFWSTLNQILQNGSVSSWYMKSREGTFKSKTGRPLYSMSRPKDWQNHVPSLVTKVVWLLWFSQKVV